MNNKTIKKLLFKKDRLKTVNLAHFIDFKSKFKI